MHCSTPKSEFRVAVFSAPNAMMLVNQDGQIVLANPRAESMFGYEREELIGRSIELLIPASRRTIHRTHVKEYFAAPRPRLMNARRELPGLKKDGREIPLEIGLSPVYMENETLVLSSLIDITSRKQAEEALREARDAAQAASRSKSAFVAHMSHEIRTPLNGVLGMLELLDRTQVTEQQQEHIQLAKLSAESLLQVLNDILDFSKIEAGKLELESTAFQLRDLIGDTLLTLGLKAAEKQLELVCQIAPDVPDDLFGDAGRLRQVLINLVGNAIKFTHEGEIVVKLDCLSVSTRETTLRFSVRDTGVGIAKDKQQRVFEAFGQADSSTTRRFGGTGLGLSISQQLIEMMGGQLKLESQQGSGSTFWFDVTLDRQLVGPERKATEPPQYLCAGASVMVVDDNATNRDVLQELLTSWGMRARCIAGARQALHVLTGSESDDAQVDLILLDSVLPAGQAATNGGQNENGWILAEKIREIPRYDEIPIIMLAVSASRASADRCATLGVTGQLRKPIKQSELLDEILFALDKTTERPRPHLTQDIPPAARPLRILLAEDGVVNQKVARGFLEAQGHTVLNSQ